MDQNLFNDMSKFLIFRGCYFRVVKSIVSITPLLNHSYFVSSLIRIFRDTVVYKRQTKYALLICTALSIAHASIELTPLPHGSANVPFFATTFLVEESGTLVDLTGKEFAITGTVEAAISNKTYFSLLLTGIAAHQPITVQGAQTVVHAGNLERSGNGSIGIVAGPSGDIDPGEGLQIGINAYGLPASLAVQITRITIEGLEAGELGQIVNSASPQNVLSFGGPQGASGSDLYVADKGTLDLSALELTVRGGEGTTERVSILSIAENNSSNWRIKGIQVDIIPAPPSFAHPSSWRSVLYPMDWSPFHEDTDFYSDKIIQDFSHAGYHQNNLPITQPSGPVLDVTAAPYFADPSGSEDSTNAIQAAIDAVSSAGGGVVFMPAGTYRLSVSPSARAALVIKNDKTVLRGAGIDQTFLYNTSTYMRGKSVILVEGSVAASPFHDMLPSARVVENNTAPTQRIHVEDTSDFSPGDLVVFRSDATDGWIADHNEFGWRGFTDRFEFAYIRELIGVNTTHNILTLDAPIRYSQLLREYPRVYRMSYPIQEVGLEAFSIGNKQHDGEGWEQSDYRTSGTAAYDVHGSYLIEFRRARHCWMQQIHSYQPSENSLSMHMLSNGIYLSESSNLTLKNVSMQRVQYAGGGGNGYSYRIQESMECLLQDCVAGYNRHGFVFSHTGTSGNVIHRSLDMETRWSASGSAGAQSSDHHMHFSHSNLVDSSTADNSYFSAAYRPNGSEPEHNLTAAHSVFWNMNGMGSRYDRVVRTQQGRYGYAIGTRGANPAVDTVGSRPQTDPEDHVEGIGLGNFLQPRSLFDDQVLRRQSEIRLHVTSPLKSEFPENSVPIKIIPEWGSHLGISQTNLHYECEVIDTLGTVTLQDTAADQFLLTTTSPGVYAVVLRARIGTDGPIVGQRHLSLTFSYPEPDGFLGDNSSLIQVNASADSYVKRDTVDTYGAEQNILLKEFNSSNGRAAFLHFDVSGINIPNTEHSHAFLVLHQLSGMGAYSGHVLASPDVRWNEATLNWDNYPYIPTLVGTWEGTGTNGTIRIPLDSILPIINSASSITLKLEIPHQLINAPTFSFASRESTDPTTRPYLEIYANPGSSYDDWLSTNTISTEKSVPNDRQISDGPTNLLSYVSGLDPRQVNPIPMFQYSGSNSVTVYLPWLGNLDTASYFYLEQSTDLQSWNPVPHQQWWSTATDGFAATYQATLDIPPDQQNTLYRIRIVADF